MGNGVNNQNNLYAVSSCKNGSPFSVLYFILAMLVSIPASLFFIQLPTAKKAEAAINKPSKEAVTQFSAARAAPSGDWGQGSWGGGAPGGSGSGSCVGCNNPGGGGNWYGGNFWSTTEGSGVWGGFAGAWNRTSLSSWSSPPEPIGTYGDLPFRNSTVRQTEIDIYNSQGRPCAAPQRYYVVPNAEGTESVLVKMSNNWTSTGLENHWHYGYGVASKNLGVFWKEDRFWLVNDGKATTIGDLRWQTRNVTGRPGGECITPPEPKLLWRDCPIRITDVYMSGPWGQRVNPAGRDSTPISTAKDDTKVFLKQLSSPPPSREAAPADSWWYTRNSQPIDLKQFDGKNNLSLLQAIRAYPDPSKRFTAFYVLAKQGRIAPMIAGYAMSWKDVWTDIIAPCGGMWIDSKYGAFEKTGLESVGNYNNELKLERVRCHMVVYPGYTTTHTGSNIGTGSGAYVETATWGEQYSPLRYFPPNGKGGHDPDTVLNPQLYGCGANPYVGLKQDVTLSVFRKCLTSDKSSPLYFEGKDLGYYTITVNEKGQITQEKSIGTVPAGFSKAKQNTFDFNNYWWNSPGTEGCGGGTPSTPPPTTPPPSSSSVTQCYPATPTITITANGKTTSSGKAVVLADGSPVTVKWEGLTPTVKNPYTGAVVNTNDSTKIRNFKTVLSNNADGGPNSPYGKVVGDTPESPVVIVPGSPSWGVTNGWSPTFTTAMQFFQGTKVNADGEPKSFNVIVKQTAEVSHEEKTFTISPDGSGGWIIQEQPPKISWVEAECKSEAKIQVTETRVGN